LSAATAAVPGIAPPERDAMLGLYRARDFRTIPGGASSDIAGAAAAWYFDAETVAVPSVEPVAGFARDTRPMHDVRRWNEAHAAAAPEDRPPLVWIGAPDVLHHARIDEDAALVRSGMRTLALQLVPKLALNRSWFDRSSAAFFTAREVSLRGTLRIQTFEARVVWPEDFRIGPDPAPRIRLPNAPTPGEALRPLIRGALRADAPFEAATLWERTPGASWLGKTALAFVVNGAQGDDDEAHAGHFAIVTGRVGGDGSIGDWLANNFYSLDLESEKGILAAPLPLSGYQGDLNAGQSWYRPSWILVAVLDAERAAMRVQSALGRVYRQFWRHQLRYYHPADNCTSISIDTLRGLGMSVPVAGPTSRTLAWLGLPWLVARERSLEKAKTMFDYLCAERTRLLPAIAIEAVFDALWGIAHGRGPSQGGVLDRELAQDLVALAFARIPQFPSSRAWGGPPVVSLAEYRSRVPADPAKRRIIPLPARAFPDAMRDEDLLPPPPHASDLAVRVWSVALLGALAAAAAWWRA
jgi:hypothetical protein